MATRTKTTGCQSCRTRYSCVLAGLDAEGAATATKLGRVLAIGPKETLFRQGEPTVGLYVLCGGAVRLLARSKSGKTLLLGFHQPGDLLGEPMQGAHHYSAELVSACTIRLFPGPALMELGRLHPEVLLEVIRRQSESLAGLSVRLLEIGCEGVRERLAHLLWDLASEHGDTTREGATIDLSLSQRSLAEMIGCSRQAVNKELSGLERRGWIRRCAGRISIQDKEQLGILVG